MGRIRRDDRHRARAAALGLALDGDVQLALDDLPDFLLLMVMAVDVGALVELPPDESIVRGVEEFPAPAAALVQGFDLRGVEKRHGESIAQTASPAEAAR